MPLIRRAALLALVSALAAGPAHAEPAVPDLQAFRDIYRTLVEIDTTDTGDTLRAAEAAAAFLKNGGFPATDVHVISTGPRKGNVVARLRGDGTRKPILLLAHIDVVPPGSDKWAHDPFKFVEADGYFHGRGVIDDKAMAAIFTANVLEYMREGLRPQRDIILALTTDEELARSPHNGIKWLLDNRRELIDAEFAINEGGGGALRKGKPFRLAIQLAEKVYQTYVLEVTNPGGHSASPQPENAIYRLATALTKLARYEFPPRLNAVTRASFERLAGSESPAVAEAIKALLAGRTDAKSLAPLTANPSYNAQMRTTCVATLLEAGTVENALPQSARATVNCRILPDEAVDEVAGTLARAIGDDKVTITPQGKPVASPPSPLHPEVVAATERLAAEMWPGVPIQPTMSAGYTDNRWLRAAGIPAYGLSGLFSEQGSNGVHGVNERVAVKDVYASKAFLYRLVKELAAPPPQSAGAKP